METRTFVVEGGELRVFPERTTLRFARDQSGRYWIKENYDEPWRRLTKTEVDDGAVTARADVAVFVEEKTHTRVKE